MFHFFQSENSSSGYSPVFSGILGDRYHISGRLRAFRFGFLLVALFMLFFSGILTNTVAGLSNREELSSSAPVDHLLSSRGVQNSLNSPDSVPESGN